jgi:hypothetical protein
VKRRRLASSSHAKRSAGLRALFAILPRWFVLTRLREDLSCLTGWGATPGRLDWRESDRLGSISVQETANSELRCRFAGIQTHRLSSERLDAVMLTSGTSTIWHSTRQPLVSTSARALGHVRSGTSRESPGGCLARCWVLRDQALGPLRTERAAHAATR